MESRRGLEIRGGGVIGGPLRMPGGGAVPAAVPPTASRAVPFRMSGCRPDIGRGGGARHQERVPNDHAIPKAVPDAFYGPGRPDACPTIPTGIRTFLADDPVPVTRSTGPSMYHVAADATDRRTGPLPEGAIAGRCR